MLESAGLLSVRRGAGGGIFVISDLVPSDALSNSVAVEEHMVADVLRARRVLEYAVADEAMRVAREDDYAEIQRTIDLLRAALGNRRHVMRADQMFHRAIVRAAHSRTLEIAMRGVGRQLAPIRDSYTGGVELDTHTLDVHTRQLAAMRTGDRALLREVLDEHLGMLEDAVAAGRGITRAELMRTR